MLGIDSLLGTELSGVDPSDNIFPPRPQPPFLKEAQLTDEEKSKLPRQKNPK